MAIASPAADARAPDEAPVDAPEPIEQIAASVSAEAPLARVRATPWERHYITLALVLDTLTGFAASVVAFFAWPGPDGPPTFCFALTLAFPAVWAAAVGLAGGYDTSHLSVGPEEFNRVGLAGISLLAFVAIIAWSTQIDIARGYVAIALFGATAATIGARYALRKYVHRQRAQGRFQQRTVIVGTPRSVTEISQHFRRFAYHGYSVVGAVSAPERSGAFERALGPIEDIMDTIRHNRADNVAVMSDHGLTPDELQHLAWQLEREGTDLFVAPSLTDVAGPRLSVRPVEGVSLLHVKRPAFSGLARIVKSTYEVVLAGLGLVILAPALAVIAIAIKLDSPGPVVFRQTRVGRLGEPFRIVKFRSMVVDAELRRHEVEALNEGDGPLFKSRRDPRVTKVGAFLRRTSLDELPQLWNVLLGDMSLVGPRPHLPDEVARFGPASRRRLLVKPGLTGMWQISGRSDLSWDESVRVDLRYVENWSLGLDAMILWKTVGVVVRGDGAY